MALFACLRNAGQEVTSTSVTTGNPTGIRIIFKKDSSLVSINGKAEVFAVNQIPVPGFSPEPLLSIAFQHANSIEVKAESIESIADSLWPEKSYGADSIHKFNIVVSSDSMGLILGDLSFRNRKSGSDFYKSGVPLPNFESHAEVTADLVELTDYIGKTDTNRLSIVHDYYLFIYGTGFVAKGESGVFEVSRLPQGQYAAFFLPLYKKNEHSQGIDSTPVFSLIEGLNTENDSLYRGSVFETVELPDSLKPK